MYDELARLTAREWWRALGILSNQELTKLEGQVAPLVYEAVTLAARSPVLLANRLIEQSEWPMLRSYGVIPAYMTGGKDLLDLAAEDGDSSIHNIRAIWPKVREQFRGRLILYFSRLAAADIGAAVRRGNRSRHMRVVSLAFCLQYIFRAQVRRRPELRTLH